MVNCANCKKDISYFVDSYEIKNLEFRKIKGCMVAEYFAFCSAKCLIEYVNNIMNSDEAKKGFNSNDLK